MAKLPAGFNPNQFDPTQGGSGGQLPVGRHPVVIRSDKIEAAKSGNGGLLELHLEAIDGPAKGASMVYRLNLFNNNPTAVDIANRQLSALCYVTNQFQLGQNGDDTSVLHNIPFVVDVEQQPGSDKYTQVARVYDINGNEPKAGGQAQQAPASNGFQQAAAPQAQPQAQPAEQPAAAPAWGTQAPPQHTHQPAPQSNWAQPAQQQAAAEGAAPATGWQQNAGGAAQQPWGQPK